MNTPTDRATAAIAVCQQLEYWNGTASGDKERAIEQLAPVLEAAEKVNLWPDRTLDEMVQDYGWGIAHTGGGCTALEKDLGKHYAYITDDAEVPSDPKAGCTLSFYPHDADHNEPVLTFTCPDLETAMKMADMLEDPS